MKTPSRQMLIAALMTIPFSMAFAENIVERTQREHDEAFEMAKEVRERRERDDAEMAERARRQAESERRSERRLSYAQEQQIAARNNTEQVQRELGARIPSYQTLQSLNRGLSADELAAISAPVRLAKIPNLLPHAEYDQNSLYRQGNVLQFVFTRPLEGSKGFVGWRVYATCSGKFSKVVASSSHLAPSKEAAIKKARDPSFLGVNSQAEYFTAEAQANNEIHSLCARARTAPFEVSVPIYISGTSWISIPVLSIQKAAGNGQVSWVTTWHSTPVAGPSIATPAWDAPSAPKQSTVSVSGSQLDGTQWSADCRTGRSRSAALNFNNVLRLVNPSMFPIDGKLMSSMPAHTRAGYELACSALGLL